MAYGREKSIRKTNQARKENFLQMITISDMIFSMEVTKEESRQAIEPQFLSQAQTSGVKVRIGQMNKTEHEGTIRDIGRYEINLEENGKIVTLLKQEISYLTAPHPSSLFPGRN